MTDFVALFLEPLARLKFVEKICYELGLIFHQNMLDDSGEGLRPCSYANGNHGYRPESSSFPTIISSGIVGFLQYIWGFIGITESP